MRKGLVGLLLSISMVGMGATASAQSTFHVKEFDYKQGDWIFETINAQHSGLSTRSNFVRAGHELGLAYAVNNFWLPKVLITFDKDEGRSYDVQRLLFENTFTFKPIAEGKDGLGFAWFQSLEGALNDRQTNATAFGPILTGQLGKFSFSTNTFFEKTFGQNHVPGLNFQFPSSGAICEKLRTSMGCASSAVRASANRMAIFMRSSAPSPR